LQGAPAWSPQAAVLEPEPAIGAPQVQAVQEPVGGAGVGATKVGIQRVPLPTEPPVTVRIVTEGGEPVYGEEKGRETPVQAVEGEKVGEEVREGVRRPDTAPRVTAEGGVPPAPPTRRVELGDDDLITGVGKSWTDLRNQGHNWIDNGGHPDEVIRVATQSGQTTPEFVGVIEAQYDRLGDNKRVAQQAWEADPTNPELEFAMISAEEMHQAWRQQMEPVLRRAGRALNEARIRGVYDLNTLSGVHDLFVELWKGSRETTPELRNQFRQVADVYRQAGDLASDSIKKAVAETKRLLKPNRSMNLEELKSDFANILKDQFKDCIS
jgi:hypothetical protein